MDDAFIGRDAELAALADLLDQHRLVTIVGAPGVGKTRLAREAVAPTRAAWDEVIWVQLATLGEADDLPTAVAREAGIADSPGRTSTERLLSALGVRRALLILDNAEHLREAVAAIVADVQLGCPEVHTLVTSRQRVGLEEEVVFGLSPLGVPDAVASTADEIERYPAVALLLDRARRRVAGYASGPADMASVAGVCRRLDGLPLAIELVAARADVVAPAQMEHLLDRRLSVAVHADPDEARHRTLESAIAWSWDLLGPSAQMLLRRLSVFAGGCTRSAARAVCVGSNLGPDEVDGGLDKLVASSLLAVETSGPDERFVALETVRRFARDRLVAAGEAADAKDRHARWAIALAEEGEPSLVGAAQTAWLRRLDAERFNFAAAMDWLVPEQHGDGAARLTAALTLWWRARGRYAEGAQWVKWVLDLGTELTPQIRARLLWGGGLLASMIGDWPSALSAAEESLRVARGVADDLLVARNLLVLGSISQPGGRDDEIAMLNEAVAVAERSGDAWTAAHALALLGARHGASGDSDQARAFLRRSLSVGRTSGDPQALAFTLVELGLLEFDQADLPAARSALNEALVLARGAGLSEEATILVTLGIVELRAGNYARSQELLEAGRNLAQRLDVVTALAEAAHYLACLAQARGDLPSARDLFELVLRVTESLGLHMSRPRAALSQVVAELGNKKDAEAMALSAFLAARNYGRPRDVAHALGAIGSLARRRGDLMAASAAFEDAIAVTADLPELGDAIEGLAGLRSLDGHDDHAVTLFASVAAVRDAHGMARFDPDSPFASTDAATLADRMDASRYQAARRAGRSMALSQAARLALMGPHELAGSIIESDDGWDSLGDDDKEIARLAVAGLTNREIAGELYVSFHTVHNRLAVIYDALGVRSRATLARRLAGRLTRR